MPASWLYQRKFYDCKANLGMDNVCDWGYVCIFELWWVAHAWVVQVCSLKKKIKQKPCAFKYRVPQIRQKCRTPFAYFRFCTGYTSANCVFLIFPLSATYLFYKKICFTSSCIVLFYASIITVETDCIW